VKGKIEEKTSAAIQPFVEGQASNREDEEMEASAAPLLDHLIELRQRLIKALIGFFAAFVVCFIVKGYILDALLIPYRWAVKFSGDNPDQISLQSTEILETFLTQLKIAAFGAVIIAFPYIALHLYRFIAPGLYRNERMAFLPFLVASPLLFLVGGAFVYYVVAPLVFWFGLTQQVLPGGAIVKLVPKISDYLNFLMSLMLIFGLVFQLPVVTSLMVRVGLLSAEWLASKRRWAVLASFVVAAMVTPSEIFSMLGLALPTILLYELSIVLARLIERKKRRTRNELTHA